MILTYTRDDITIEFNPSLRPVVWPAVLATWPTIAADVSRAAVCSVGLDRIAATDHTTDFEIDSVWIGLSSWCNPHDRFTGARVPA